MTTCTLRQASPAKTRADAVVVGVVQAGKHPSLAPGAEDVAAAYGRRLRPLLASLGVTGKAGDVARVPTTGTLASPLVVLVGLGKDADSPTAVRRAAGVAARAVTNAASVAIALPAGTPELVRAVTEGWLLGGYAFTAYKKDPSGHPAPGTVGVLSPRARQQEMVAAFERAQRVAAAVATTRDWVNMPPGDLTPPLFSDQVLTAVDSLAKGRGGPRVGVRVYDETELADLGCGGLLGVGAASAAPPRLVELTWEPDDAARHVALVGKGITFDSGGLSIKPGNAMTTMKSDMAGAAAVVQATLAAASLGLPVRVSTFVPMAENMISGSSTRPGDVLRIYGGRTVEVTNTDAEGRLVLADGLVRAVEAAPDAIIDVATLTGAMVVSLGDRIAGAMGTPEVVEDVRAAGGRAGEPVWPMPIPDEMDERIHSSKVADLAQTDWIRWGSGLYAAAFLREFTAGLPWAHVDIAGPSFNGGSAWGHVPPGGTGFGVATLVEYLDSAAAG